MDLRHMRTLITHEIIIALDYDCYNLLLIFRLRMILDRT